MQPTAKKQQPRPKGGRNYRNTAVRNHTHNDILALANRHRLDNIEVMDVAIAHFKTLPTETQASLIRGEKVSK